MNNTKELVEFKFNRLKNELIVSNKKQKIIISYELEQKKEKELSFLIKINSKIYNNRFLYFENLLKNPVLKYKININTENELNIQVNEMIVNGIIKLFQENNLINKHVYTKIDENFFMILDSNHEILQIVEI